MMNPSKRTKSDLRDHNVEILDYWEKLAADRERRADAINGLRRLLNSEKAPKLRSNIHGKIAKILHGSGDLKTAINHYRKSIKKQRSSADELYNIGTAFLSVGLYKQSRRYLLASWNGDKQCPKKCHNLAYVLSELGEYNNALYFYDLALQTDPSRSSSLSAIALLLDKLGMEDCAIKRAHLALKKARGIEVLSASNNLGYLLRKNKNYKAAKIVLTIGHNKAPRFMPILRNLATLFRAIGDLKSAEHIISLMLSVSENDHHALLESAEVKEEEYDFPGAKHCYEAVLSYRPNDIDALIGLRSIQRRTCDWSQSADIVKHQLLQNLERASTAVQPLRMLFDLDKPLLIRQMACNLIGKEFPYAASTPQGGKEPLDVPLPKSSRSTEKIRIGYLSADFRSHAGSTLCARVFELHDRTQFSVFGYSLCGDDLSQERKRILSAFDAHSDLSGISDNAAAEIIRRDSIDILVCRDGHNKNSRLGIFARRPSPCQISWCGYPGTIGAPFIDYIVADHIVIPKVKSRQYTESIIRLPNCYQPNDDQRYRASDRMSRKIRRGPAQEVSFGCFNSPEKITRESFQSWLAILKRVPHSDLHLMVPSTHARENMLLELSACDVDRHRVKLHDRIPYEQHMNRFTEIDLFLDTFPYGGHTVLSEALWNGCPAVSLVGNSFHTRVGGSLLAAVGLPELAFGSLDGYVDCAVTLGNSPGRLHDIRVHLSAAPNELALFNSEVYTRHLENAFKRALANCTSGNLSEDIDVT